jgi:hypothetical protein
MSEPSTYAPSNFTIDLNLLDGNWSYIVGAAD